MKKIFEILKQIPRTLHQILSGEIFKTTGARRIYPFLLFMVVLALFWIGSTYSAIHTMQEIKKTEKELEVATAELRQLERRYADISKPSRLIEKLAKDSDTAKIKMAHGNTYKIIVNKEGE